MAVSIKTIRGGEEKSMDFSMRNSQPQTVGPNAQQSIPGNQAPVSNHHKISKQTDRNKLFTIITGIMFAAVIILFVALVAYIGFGSQSNANENKLVKTSRLQAVFLNTGQVYFGNIVTLNDKYYTLENIYYLQTSSSSSTTTTSSSDTSVSLVKLGCELHAPYDQMVINSDEVTFWENLQPTGQVAKAVAAFQKENPNGQKCSDQSAATTGTTSTSGVQGTSTTAGTATTGSTTATK
jgi:hypothetical protein